MRLRFLAAPVVALLCAAPALAQNLITDPNFDSGLDGWQAGAGTTWDVTRDADGNAASGSAQGARDFASPQEVDTLLAQCIPVLEPSAQYRFDGKVFIPGGQAGSGGVYFAVTFYPQTACGGAAVPFITTQSPVVTATNAWTSSTLQVPVPAVGHSAMLFAYLRASSLGAFRANVDDLSLQVMATCQLAEHTVCLLGNRFQVTATFDAGGGNAGSGHVGLITSDTGYFWFFDPTNVEVIAKVIDGCGLGGHYWFFAGGLTNVRVTITVTDFQTGAVRTYTNPSGVDFVPIEDTNAFPCS
jgi:hypothetical protein